MKKIKHHEDTQVKALVNDDEVYYENPFPQDADDDNFKNSNQSSESYLITINLFQEKKRMMMMTVMMKPS